METVRKIFLCFIELLEACYSSVFINYRSGSNILHLEYLESTTYLRFLKVNEVYAREVEMKICPTFKLFYWVFGGRSAVKAKACLLYFYCKILTIDLTSLTPGKKASICSSALSLFDKVAILYIIVPYSIGCSVILYLGGMFGSKRLTFKLASFIIFPICSSIVAEQRISFNFLLDSLK